MSENSPHVQVKLVTPNPRFAIPDGQISLEYGVTQNELNSLICSLLEGVEDVPSFNFLIKGEFLRVSLKEHIEQKDLSLEDVIEIEYVEKDPAPIPDTSLPHEDWVSCIDSSANHIISGCYDNTVHLWDDEGRSLTTIPAHSAAVKCVAWIHHGKSECTFLSGSQDQMIHIWQWNQEKNEIDCMHACRGHAGSVDCVAVHSSAEKFCSGSWDGTLKLWSAEVNTEENDDDTENRPIKKSKSSGRKVSSRVPMLTLSGHSEGVTSVLWMDTDEVCTASFDHTLKLWDMQSARDKQTIQGSKPYLSADYSKLNGLLVTGSSDRHIRLYDPRSTEGAIVKSIFTSHDKWVPSVAWSPIHEHLFISGSYDHVMKMWDLRSPKAPMYDLSGHDDIILSVHWSESNKLMCGGADKTLKIFNYKMKKGG